MRDHYDFSKGVRGKYADRVSKDVTFVALDPDVADAFPTSEEVNRALRGLARERAPSREPTKAR